VIAVDKSGNRSVPSTMITVAMAVDNTPPQAPSTPTAGNKLGTVAIKWDGLPVSGTWPPDFDHVEVHMSLVNNFTPTTATQIDTLYGEGVAIVTDQAYGIPLFFKLVAVDRGGLKSAPSAQATASPARLVGSDLDPNAITYEQIAFKDPGNVIPDGSFETSTYRAMVASNSAAAWQFISIDHYLGDWAATINAATSSGTARQLALMTPAQVQNILPTDKLFCRYAYKATAGATGNLNLVVEWTLQDNTHQFTALTGATKNGTWQQVAAQLTAPANTTDFRIYMELDAGGTSGTYTVDAVEVRRTVGTEIIEDAAIGNAQIANLAVNNAKIASLDAGKITAGTMTADILNSGRITTASSGNRVEMTGTGIRLYHGSVLKAFFDPSIGQIRIYNETDASPTSTGHGLQFGDDNDYNLILDQNEIMARYNGDLSWLYLNRQGGPVWIGSMIITDYGIRGSATQGAQAMKGQRLSSATNISVTHTAPFYDSPNLSITFTAPESGRVAVGVGGACSGQASGSCLIGFDVQNGNPGGSTFSAWDVGNAFEVWGANYVRGINFGFVDGMTAGNTYSVNCRTMYTGTGPGTVYFRRLMVLPQM
jgi:hypothetical protein